VTIKNDVLGSCTLAGAPSVTTTNVTCDGTTKVFNVSDNVTIHTTGLETDNAVELSIASISDTATGGTIDSEDGSIVLTLPSAGNYSVAAQSPTQGTVDFGTAPAGCNVQTAGDAGNSATLTCNSAGANYAVTAGTDGLGDSNIVASYK
jgi:hypothetical protein